MGYNPFRWWTKGRINKPLKADAPLLLKIRNGDFDYSYMFNEAKEMRETQHKTYQQAYDNYGGTDERNRIQAALEASQMKRVKALKLEFEANRDENIILWKLRSELAKEFDKDLWDKAMERQRGKGTLENLYEWYRKNSKVKTPQSIQDIQLRKPNTKGLEYLF
jgi:hypothetical protein